MSHYGAPVNAKNTSTWKNTLHTALIQVTPKTLSVETHEPVLICRSEWMNEWQSIFNCRDHVSCVQKTDSSVCQQWHQSDVTSAVVSTSNPSCSSPSAATWTLTYTRWLQIRRPHANKTQIMLINMGRECCLLSFIVTAVHKRNMSKEKPVLSRPHTCEWNSNPAHRHPTSHCLSIPITVNQNINITLLRRHTVYIFILILIQAHYSNEKKKSAWSWRLYLQKYTYIKYYIFTFFIYLYIPVPRLRAV